MGLPRIEGKIIELLPLPHRITVLHGAGLRRAEVVTLELANWKPEEGGLTVRSGKGDKDRTTYLDDGAVAALSDWLERRGVHSGALLHPTVKGGRISPRSMSDQAELDILRQRGEQAQVSAFSPHDFRRIFISNLPDAGAESVRCRNWLPGSRLDQSIFPAS